MRVKMPKTTRKAAAQPRATDTRARILQAAEDAFAYYGFSGASLQDIADRVGIKKASLFYYFKGKEELYGEVIQRVFKALEEIVFPTLYDEQSGYAEKITGLVGSTFDLLANHPNYARMLYRELMDNEEGVSEVSGMLFGPLLQPAVGFLKTGMENGALKPQNPMHFIVSSLALISFYFVAVPLFEPHFGRELLSPASLKERRKEVNDFCLNAILVGR
jgi:TetR/AcrR family transcriptional regulator